MYQYTANRNVFIGVCRKCLCQHCRISQVVRQRIHTNGQPQKKPVGQMYSAFDAVHLIVVDWRIGDVVVMRHQRLVGRSRAGTAALVHVHHDV